MFGILNSIRSFCGSEVAGLSQAFVKTKLCMSRVPVSFPALEPSLAFHSKRLYSTIQVPIETNSGNFSISRGRGQTKNPLTSNNILSIFLGHVTAFTNTIYF